MDVRVVSNDRETPTTRKLRLGLGGQVFSYQAGQAAALAAGGPPTPYSIASSPGETGRHGWLEFLIKVDGSNRFGAVVEQLAPGSLVDLTGPFGAFTLDGIADGTPLLFVAGGTGIAPVRSMIRSALDSGRRGSLSLLYSNRSPQEFAYRDQLTQLTSQDDLKLSLTLTGEADDWAHARGRAGTAHLSELVQPGTTAFICGPPAMVRELPAALASLGIPRARVITEDW